MFPIPAVDVNSGGKGSNMVPPELRDEEDFPRFNYPDICLNRASAREQIELGIIRIELALLDVVFKWIKLPSLIGRNQKDALLTKYLRIYIIEAVKVKPRPRAAGAEP